MQRSASLTGDGETTASRGRGGWLSVDRLLRLFREAFPLFLALGLLNASNYIFHVAVSRLLGPTEYGALAAILAVVMVLSVPLGVVQTVMAKKTAILRAEGRDAEAGALVAGTTKAMGGFGMAGLLVLVAVSPVLAVFLHTNAGSAALLGPYWLVSLLASVALGVLQGRLRFTVLAGVALAGVAVRLASGIGLVWAGLGVFGAVLATVLAQAVILGVALGLLRLPKGSWKVARWTLQPLRGEFANVLLTLGSFWILAEIDVVLARHYLPSEQAGFYASAGLIARGLLFLTAALSIVALPRFAEVRGQGDEALRRLRLMVAATGGLLIAAYPALILLRRPVVALAFGRQFLPAADLIPLLGAAMGLLAVVNLLVYFHIAAGTRTYRLVFAGVAAEVVLIGLFHESPWQVGLVVLAVGSVVAALQYYAAAAVCRWQPPLVGEGGDQPARPWLSDPATLDVTVVLPCHNAGGGLRPVLKTLSRELEEVGSWEIIVVSDGSTDETVRIAEGIGSQNIRVLQEERRTGKGHALRAGLAQARGRYIAFMDADGDIDPSAIRPSLALMELYEPDIVLGSKRHPLSEVSYPALRRILSWTYHKLCRLLFRINVRDTQTGLKLIRRDVLATVLPRMLEKRYAFDLELLVVARRLGFRRVFEAPVRIDYRFSSQVNVGAAFHILLDTMAIFYRRYVLNTYRWDLHPIGVEDRIPSGPVMGADGLAAAAVVPEVQRGDGHLRILFLNWRDIRNPEAGGAEIFTHEVAKRWVEWGHEVSLLTSRFRGSSRAETVDGVRIRRIGRLRNGTFHVLVQRELARLRGFDVVIDEINTMPFLTPLWQRRLPLLVALIHQLAADVLEAELPKPVAAVGRRLEPRLLRLYRGIPLITVSESTRQDLVRLGLKHVWVVPDGRDEPPHLDGIEKEPVPTFLFVGRLAANKRPEHAVEAFRLICEKLPQARLWIVGHGPLERTLRRMLPEGAEMLGYLPRDELYRRMARAHCLLVSSVREGWGLVVTEANSVGTPAVGYDVPGLRDSIRDGETGLLARSTDPAGLAREALALLQDSAAYHSMRRTGIERAKAFHWEATAMGVMEVIRRHLPSPARPGRDRASPADASTIAYGDPKRVPVRRYVD